MFRLLRIQYTGENATIYLTVSRVIDRIKYEMGRDKGIRLRVEKLRMFQFPCCKNQEGDQYYSKIPWKPLDRLNEYRILKRLTRELWICLGSA